MMPDKSKIAAILSTVRDHCRTPLEVAAALLVAAILVVVLTCARRATPPCRCRGSAPWRYASSPGSSRRKA